MVIDMEEDVRRIYRPTVWAKRLEAYKAAEAALRESAPKVRKQTRLPQNSLSNGRMNTRRTSRLWKNASR